MLYHLALMEEGYCPAQETREIMCEVLSSAQQRARWCWGGFDVPL